MSREAGQSPAHARAEERASCTRASVMTCKHDPLSSDCGQLVKSCRLHSAPVPRFSYRSGCMHWLSSAEGHSLRSEGLCCMSPGTTHENMHMNVMCHGPRRTKEDVGTR